MGRPRLTPEQQIAGFWRRVVGGDFETCWIWTGPGGRYGSCSFQGGSVSTHRFAYELMVGEIPEGLHLDHLCRNTMCCNPWHLDPVTPLVNTRRGMAGEMTKARNAARTHCPHGHEYAGANLYIDPDGSRTCRQCQRDGGTRYRDRNRTPVIVKTHCVHGHLYDEANSYIRPDGHHRECRTCIKARLYTRTRAA